jgi:hypothetical protein
MVRCAHHLYLDVSRKTGAIKSNFPDIDVEEMAESCSLDVADRGGATLEESAGFLNVTRERFRQLETLILDKLRARPKDIAVLLEYANDPQVEAISPLAQARRDSGEGSGGVVTVGRGKKLPLEPPPGDSDFEDESFEPARLFAEGRPAERDVAWVWRVAQSRDEERQARSRGERFDLGGVPLSPQTAAIVEHVRGLWATEGRGPSKDEVAAHLGLEGNTATKRVRVDSLLQGLRQAGWVTVSKKTGITIGKPAEYSPPAKVKDSTVSPGTGPLPLVPKVEKTRAPAPTLPPGLVRLTLSPAPSPTSTPRPRASARIVGRAHVERPAHEDSTAVGLLAPLAEIVAEGLRRGLRSAVERALP